MAFSLAVWSFNTDGILQHNVHLPHYSGLKFPRQKVLDKIRFLLPSKIPVSSFQEQNLYPLRKKSNLIVSAGWSLGDQDIDSPDERPPYDSYIDSNTGELVPARGARPSIPDRDFWSGDTAIRARRGQTLLPSHKSPNTLKPSSGQNPGSRRKKSRVRAAIPKSSAGETADNEFTPEPSNYSSEEEEEETSTPNVIQELKTDEIVDAEELARKYGEPHPFVRKRSEEFTPPLLNEELWWNWRKPPIGMERWTEWKKTAPSSDAAMAMAMAEAGQIKIFGEKPTVAEASLARARKRALKNERLSLEEERKRELGPMAYYQEWVKAWKKDTYKEAVQKHFEETGEDVHTQLANMFQHQTEREYRIMMGTDVRILRDPVVIRMRPEHKKAVFGGDPAYPTINYEQAPDHTVDYRGPNFHEPVREPLDRIRQRGRLISQDVVDKIRAKQREEQEDEDDELDEAMSVAVDIGEKNDEGEDEVEEEEEDDVSDLEIADSHQSSLEPGSEAEKDSGRGTTENSE
ncbi:protein PLASTID TRANSCRIPTIONALLY ACTIVE 12, chloroplastic [Cryptomeria japonica]|uniref:protein PLASTID TRANSCRIPTIONALLY ACTIVE 12, chloroplastic n=1 Tax=Cryptomeria japonica TaxID=3369 RepID=UPI0025ABA682|nr:protein PLASTID TRANSCRIPTIONALLY ACTIVE 12, chloroplastic [Cryptomeria japonica]XP_057830569.1 protein PLASTID TRANSCRIPTIONALLY ACTIVE 12, chloroplastic [Cryptomeria japonica]XP_057830570.1 protein PLASTID TRANSCRIPTIONALLY ACTIVE 12, chloroplastic [Cryptomeria japonica]XP_057830571.1 protein PLASTID TRANSCRIPTIONALLY ACTIVE 12, chloroplastic [Cryptomeria japonica]XP_057830572.1 protein PLASTID TRANSCRIPTIONALLY ACTIVE 12, chloroplastic [Cryptomeria japonica]XP_057830573.1 protein PLASTID